MNKSVNSYLAAQHGVAHYIAPERHIRGPLQRRNDMGDKDNPVTEVGINYPAEPIGQWHLAYGAVLTFKTEINALSDIWVTT